MNTHPCKRQALAPLPQLLTGDALPDLFEWVHGPLAHWARTRPHSLALANETTLLDFATLHDRVQTRARQWDAQGAPATVLLPGDAGTLEGVVEFLGVIASGLPPSARASRASGVASTRAANRDRGTANLRFM